MKRKISIIPKASVARMLVKAGAKRVSSDSVDALTDVLTGIAADISSKAAEIARLSQIVAEDVRAREAAVDRDIPAERLRR